MKYEKGGVTITIDKLEMNKTLMIRRSSMKPNVNSNSQTPRSESNSPLHI